MRDRLGEKNPESFIFDSEHAEFAGYFHELKMVPGRYGPTPVAVLSEAQTGELRSIFLFHTVLRNALIELRPVVGELVLIRYLGRERTEDGTNDYANYGVIVEGRTSRGVTWEGWAGRRRRPSPRPSRSIPAETTSRSSDGSARDVLLRSVPQVPAPRVHARLVSQDAEKARASARASQKRRRAKIRAYDQSRPRYEDPKKKAARNLVNKMLRSGRLVRQDCEVDGCGRPGEAHHLDYDQPLLLRWLCRNHHQALEHRPIEQERYGYGG